MSKNSCGGDFPGGPGVKPPNAGGTCHIARPKKFFNEKHWGTVTSCKVAGEETPPEQN